MNFYKLIVLSAAVLLCSCDQISNQQHCQSMGYEPGTSMFLQCTSQLAQQQLQFYQQWQEGARAQQAEQNANYRAMLQNLNNSYQPRPNVSTNCTRNGNYVNCTSY